MTPDWVWLIFITMFGACVGSFLNVVIYRLPEGMSVVKPPSRCPKCENLLAWYDNIPVLGWLWLRGKCRQCKCPISIQYPIVEALVALIFGGTFALLFYTDFRPPFGSAGFITVWPLVLVWLVTLAALFAATVIDARHYIIPPEIPWTVAAVAVVVLPLGVWLVPSMTEMGVGLRNAPFAHEPYIPRVNHHGAMVAFCGGIGLLLALVLLDRRERARQWHSESLSGMIRTLFVLDNWASQRLQRPRGGMIGLLFARLLIVILRGAGIIPDSFEGEDLIDEDIDLSEDIPPLKHPRKVVLRECFFIAFPLLGMLIGSYLATHIVTQPLMGQDVNGWYGVVGGVILGFLVGGGAIWLIRILGTLGFGKEAMGMGDIHLLAAIGAVIGWWESIYMCIFIAPFLGIAAVIATSGFSAITKKENRQIPYGPFLAVAAVVMMILGHGRIDWFGIMKPFATDPPMFVP